MSRARIVTAVVAGLVVLLLAVVLFLLLRPEPPAEARAVLLAAGDVARCNDDGEPLEGALLTGALIEQQDGIVAALGDLAYSDGSAEDFEECYDPAWGSFKARTRPALGNHDDNTRQAAPYFDYFSHVEMPEPEGWYSYSLRSWHVIVLNSNCGEVGGCDADDPQGRWLRQELASVETGNILAYWHAPLFSTGDHGSFDAIEDLYRMLDEAGADIILAGHDHDYQRWAPQDASGTVDPDAPRQFVVGTGGAELREFTRPAPDDLEFRQNEHWGVLRLELTSCGYTWAFIDVDGNVLDQGEADGTC